ncbi:MAG: hypothetical protein ABW137_33585 [Mycobacterium sp.]
MHYNAKMFAAIVGGSAVVTLGALSASIVGGQTAPASASGAPTMTMGATSTVTTPPKVEAVQDAAPSIKGPAPLPSEEQGLPG